MKNFNTTISILILLKLSLCFMASSQQINSFQNLLQSYIENSDHQLEYNRNQLIKGVEIFQNYLNHLNTQNENKNIQLHRCSAKKRQKCNQFAKQFVEQCTHSDSKECWKKLTFEYPKCLRCYCPFIVAKTCQATNFVLWLALNIAERNGCENLLQKQCAPQLLAMLLELAACKWCQCLAQKRGYETYLDCPNEQENLMQLLINQYLPHKKIQEIQN